MPFTIHEGATKRQMFWNIARPQEVVPENLPENWQTTMGQGLPVKQIPHLEYPRVVYKHPKKAHMEIQHRNDRFEIVGTEVVPTAHKTKIVNNESELNEALAKGWRKEPYIPAPPQKVDEGIYEDDDEDIPLLPPTPRKSTRGSKENPL